jgi:hypothetical protein
MRRHGKSLDEAVAAKPYADTGVRIGASEEQNANFVRVIYRSFKPEPSPVGRFSPPSRSPTCSGRQT